MNYQPGWWIRNRHFQSIYPAFFRKLKDDLFIRERINTPDNDFLDLDWVKNNNKRLVILTHGLEGHSRRPYILGMAKAAHDTNWDALAWNFRACSGEPNKHLPSYHSGATNDLECVIEHALAHDYDEIALIGFSIGGNKTLIHLGKNKEKLAKQIIGAVVFSVPCDLISTSENLARPANKLYMKNFLTSLEQKLKQKKAQYPEEIDLTDFSKIKDFHAFDGKYTAPMNGFSSAEEYWRKSSSKQYIKSISRPTLMVSAVDDPFLTPECFPHEIVAQNSHVILETPKHGGHVGFIQFNKQKKYWSEQRAMDYLNSLSKLNSHLS